MFLTTRFAFTKFTATRFAFAQCLALVLCEACGASVPAGAPRSAPPTADGAGVVEPADEVEATALKRLDQWPAGQAWAVGGVSVTARAPYQAASGRTCRALVFSRTEGASTRLACHDGARWFYVPDVFASSKAASLAR
jgi:hypothetical protein